jgi:para-aminobenzoate synthetase component 1
MRAFMVSTISKGYCVGFCLTQLNTASYQRLLSHASRMGDFAYLGSDGSDGARGNLSGFSAMALSRIELAPGTTHLDSHQLAERMERLCTEYRLEKSDSLPALPGGWIGIMGYELGYAREKRLTKLAPDCTFPMISAGFYLWTASHNRETDEYWLWIHPRLPETTQHILDHWLTTDA